jgi:hypothetical protein
VQDLLALLCRLKMRKAEDVDETRVEKTRVAKVGPGVLDVAKIRVAEVRAETNPDNDQDENTNSVKFVALGMRLINADIIQPAMKYAFATTVTENLRSYNSRERKQIAEAMKMAEKLAYPSAGKTMEFINLGSMNDIPVTAHDVARAYEAYGTPIRLLQGKTVHKSEHPYVPE